MLTPYAFHETGGTVLNYVCRRHIHGTIKEKENNIMNNKITVTNIDWQWDRESVHKLIFGENEGDDPMLCEKGFYDLMEKAGRTYERNLLPSEMEDELVDALRHNALSVEDVFMLPSTVEIETEDPSSWTDEDITNYLVYVYGTDIGTDNWTRDTDSVA